MGVRVLSRREDREAHKKYQDDPGGGGGPDKRNSAHCASELPVGERVIDLASHPHQIRILTHLTISLVRIGLRARDARTRISDSPRAGVVIGVGTAVDVLGGAFGRGRGMPLTRVVLGTQAFDEVGVVQLERGPFGADAG